MSEPPPDELTPELVARRLDELDELYRFWQSLRRARLLGPAEPEPRADGPSVVEEAPPPGAGR